MAGLGLFPPPAESLSTCNNAHTVWSAVVQPPTFVHGSGAMAACHIKVCGEWIRLIVSLNTGTCRICHRHRSHDERSDLNCFLQLLNKSSFWKTNSGENSLGVVKTVRMSYRHKNHDKTTGLVTSQQLLTNGDLQWLVSDVIRFVSYRIKACRIRHWHRSHHEASYLSCFRQLLK